MRAIFDRTGSGRDHGIILAIASVAFGLLLGCHERSNAPVASVHIFAAASLSGAIQEIGERFETETGHKVVYNFAGSNVLAQQIDSASLADVYISADSDWMDYLESREKTIAETRSIIATNRLVAICAVSAPWERLDSDDWCSLEADVLCMGNPDSVPAGKYAKAWLESKGCGDSNAWIRAKGRVFPASDARAALAQTLSVSNAIGIVYETDFNSARDRARLLDRSSDAIAAYPMSLTREGLQNQAAGRFYLFIQSEESIECFERYGFGIPVEKEEG